MANHTLRVTHSFHGSNDPFCAGTPVTLSDLLGGAIVAVMIVYTTEDAYVAFVAGRLTREEFFEVCQRNAEASAESSAQTRGSDLH